MTGALAYRCSMPARPLYPPSTSCITFSTSINSSTSCSGLYLRVAPLPTTRQHRCLLVVAMRGIKRGANQQLVQPQQTSSLPLSTTPFWVKLPLALAAVFVMFQMVKRFRDGNSGSLSQLESRGFIDEDRHGQDPFYSDMMKNVNTVQMEELSKDQIAAARARRLKERESYKVDIDDIVLPDNHPFAVKRPVTKEDDDLVEARLSVRKGLPIQDLSGRRGFPDDGKGQADMMQVGQDAEEASNIVRKPRVRPASPNMQPTGAAGAANANGRPAVREAAVPRRS